MLSVIIVCRKVDDLLIRTTQSIVSLNPQILIDVSPESNVALGVRKNRLISQAAYEWVLVLDTDEVVSSKLRREIENTINNESKKYHGYKIPYTNYAFGGTINFGGEQFTKTRLFRKSYGKISPNFVHEHIVIDDRVGLLSGQILHSSYRTIKQIIFKFSSYSYQVSIEKYQARERVTLRKLFLYGPHMVWARAIKDEGWRDGWRGVVIALCFGYMEALTYWMLLWRKLFLSHRR